LARAHCWGENNKRANYNREAIQIRRIEVIHHLLSKNWRFQKIKFDKILGFELAASKSCTSILIPEFSKGIA
jgi:hypothetical protein